MNSCTFNGRLGNNMFQIAATLAVAKTVGEEVVFPHTTYAGHRGPRPVDLSMFGSYFPRGELPSENSQYNESSDDYAEIPVSKNLTISGFFQSYKYFENIKDELIGKWFVPNDAINEKLCKMDISPNATGVSVRRGDYLMLQQNHCVLGEEYYAEAFDKYCADSEQLYVFSDDFDWCKQTFGGNVIYVTEDIGTQLFLMTKMKNLVISNSTFAWWGAYLNTQGGNIVMPDPWYGINYDGRGKGLIYPSWKVLKHNRRMHPYKITANMFD